MVFRDMYKIMGEMDGRGGVERDHGLRLMPCSLA
jgi:hypothetical protein